MNLKSVGIGAAVAVVIVGGGMLAGTAFAGNEHASNAANSSSISTAAKSSSSATVTSASAESSSSTKADDTASSSSSATKTSSSATAKASSSTKANDSTKSPKKDTPKPVEKPKVDPTPTAAETANKLRVPINWRLSSENKPYPDVNKYPNLWIHVSIAQQRVFLMTGNTVLYTMYCSTGMDRIGAGTPRGTFHIQKERGLSFYNPTAQGALTTGLHSTIMANTYSTQSLSIKMGNTSLVKRLNLVNKKLPTVVSGYQFLMLNGSTIQSSTTPKLSSTKILLKNLRNCAKIFLVLLV